MRLRYTPEAIADLKEIRSYIRDSLYTPNTAKRISKMILDNCAHLKVFPKTGVDLGNFFGIETDLCMLVCESYTAIYGCEETWFLSPVYSTHGRTLFAFYSALTSLTSQSDISGTKHPDC